MVKEKQSQHLKLCISTKGSITGMAFIKNLGTQKAPAKAIGLSA